MISISNSTEGITRQDLTIIVIFFLFMLYGSISAFISISHPKMENRASKVVNIEASKNSAQVVRACPYEMYFNRVLMY